MPVWLQLVCALSAGLTAALLGIALVPYLQRLRVFPPQTAPKEGGEAAGQERRPIMGGLLLLAGTVFSVVLGMALMLQFGDVDRTSATFARQINLLRGAGVYTLLLCGMGILCDAAAVRGRQKLWEPILPVFALLGALLALVLARYDETFTVNRILNVVVPAVVCFRMTPELERNTDGALITVNAVELLVLTMLLLRKFLYLPALLTLAAAGACLGCMVWGLHPARCRLGRTGAYFLAALLPIICVLCGMYKELLLFYAVFILQELYRLRKRNNQYLTEAMADSGIQPLARIAILAGLAAFCGVMALLLK